jgi:hypothetical protein
MARRYESEYRMVASWTQDRIQKEWDSWTPEEQSSYRNSFSRFKPGEKKPGDAARMACADVLRRQCDMDHPPDRRRATPEEQCPGCHEKAIQGITVLACGSCDVNL